MQVNPRTCARPSCPGRLNRESASTSAGIPTQPGTWRLEQPYERETQHRDDHGSRRASRATWRASRRTLRRRFPQWEGWTAAAIVHDWLYRTQPIGVATRLTGHARADAGGSGAVTATRGRFTGRCGSSATRLGAAIRIAARNSLNASRMQSPGRLDPRGRSSSPPRCASRGRCPARCSAGPIHGSWSSTPAPPSSPS